MIVAEPLPALRDPPQGTPAPARHRHGSHTRARTRTRVTPSRLWAMALGLAVLALIVGLVTALAADNRHTATSAALQTAEPLVVEAQAIDTNLSDADTTAADSFLQGEIQPAALRSRYMTDLARASASLAGASQAAGGDPAVTSTIRTAAINLPIYAGLVQTATFNERQGDYPLAAAYIGEANNLMRAEILPAATRLYDVENRLLASDENNAVSAPLLVVAALLIVVLLVLLIVAQAWMSRHFRRTLNVCLAVATFVVVVLGIWFTVAAVTQGSDADAASANGSGPVVIFTQARIGALQMRADDELTLLTRDSVHSYQPDFDMTAGRISRLLGSASNSAGLVEEGRIMSAQNAFVAYERVHSQIRNDDSAGNFKEAVDLASGNGPNQLPVLSSNLDGILADGIESAQQTFDQGMSGASGDIAALIWASAVLSIAIAAFVLLGFRPRIAEYR
jgi:hypothetical protein